MPRLDEFFAVLTRNPDGPIELDCRSYIFDSVAVRNPDENSEDLRRLLETAEQHVLLDGRKRILVRYRREMMNDELEQLELISTIPIGPVEDVLRRLGDSPVRKVK